MSRWFSLLVLYVAGAGLAAAVEPPAPAAGPPIPPLLLAALGKIARNYDRWAYTETRVATDEHNVAQPRTVIRFDPSLPYAEQYLPLLVEGKPPTERQLKNFRKRGEKRGERLAKEEAEGKAPGSQLPRFGFDGGTATIDLARAVVASETPESVTYEVPLRNDGHGTLPVEKFQLFVRVNRGAGAFENVALKVRSPFRVKLIVKVKSGAANIDFASVDPAHDPVAVRLAGDATASVFFLSFGGSFDLTRTDWKRVKPYSERFGVKIGPLKALDF